MYLAVCVTGTEDDGLPGVDQSQVSRFFDRPACAAHPTRTSRKSPQRGAPDQHTHEPDRNALGTSSRPRYRAREKDAERRPERQVLAKSEYLVPPGPPEMPRGGAHLPSLQSPPNLGVIVGKQRSGESRDGWAIEADHPLELPRTSTILDRDVILE